METTLKEKLRLIVEDNTTVQGRVFDYVIEALILLSLAGFAVNTLPDIPNEWRVYLGLIEIVCVSVFTLEYVLRIYVAQNKLRYIFSFYGIIDLLAILPFYLRLAVDLKFLRIFRVFRLFQTLKLVRYNRALRRFHIAAGIIREEIILFLTATAILVFISAAGIYFFENEAQPELFKSVFHSLWWAIVSMTTVGYGDVYPITTGGRIFTFFVLILGVGVVTVPAGLVASALSKARKMEEEEVDSTKNDIPGFKGKNLP